MSERIPAPCAMTADLAVDPMIEKIRSERDALRARCGELEADVDELRVDRNALEAQRNALRARVEELEASERDASRRYDARCDERDRARAERDKANNEADKAIVALRQAEADVDELRRSEELLRNDLIALADERDALRARVRELEALDHETGSRPAPAYHAALEGLRAERDALRAEVMRLRRHLSPPVDEAGAPCDGGGNVPTYRERPRPSNVKPRPDLLPAEALLAAGECLADRTDRDVGSLPWFDRAPLAETLPKYRASLMRHVLAYYADDKVDPESSRPALAHVIVNASILYRLENRAITAHKATES